MDENELRSRLKDGLSLRQIGIEIGVSLSTVRYWVKVFGLNPAYGRHGRRLTHVEFSCPCGENNPSKFYGKKRFICGKCHNAYSTERGRKNKDRIVKFLGGKCSVCGYNKNNAALDVHHKDPNKKDPAWKWVRCWRWERVEQELKTCVLLCRNCHAEEHFRDVAQLG